MADHPAYARPGWYLALLAAANLLTAVGGGRLLSAAKGVTDLSLVGSGSILALVLGNALSLGPITAARRFASSRALIAVSLAGMAATVGLIAVAWPGLSLPADDSRLAAIGAAGPGTALSGWAAWLFFAGLVLCCTLWFTSRSLRSDSAAAVSPAWLAVTEAAYFLGLIAGLLAAPAAASAAARITTALLVDGVALVLVLGCDLLGQRRAASPRRETESPAGHSSAALDRGSVWRLVAAFAASIIACQVVVFKLADTLGQSRSSAGSADAVVAAFYAGIVATAVACYWLRPSLRQTRGRAPGIALFLRGRPLMVPWAALAALTALLTLSGILGILDPLTRAGSAPWAASLAAIGSGASLFELLVLSVLGTLRLNGAGAVALAFGVASALAASALFLTVAIPIAFAGLAVTVIGGLAFATWIVRGARPPSADLPPLLAAMPRREEEVGAETANG